MSTQLVPFSKNFIEKDGEFWMTAKAISEALGYSDATKVTNLFNRHQDQFNGFTVILKLRSTDGKTYDTRVFSEEGIYLISMYANTPLARQFQVAVARFLKEQRQARFNKAVENAAAVFARFPKAYQFIKYRNMGLSQRDCAKVLGVSRWSVERMAKALRHCGLDPQSRMTEV